MSTSKNSIIFLIAGMLLLCFFVLIDLSAIFKMLLLILFCVFAIAALKPETGLLFLIIIRPCLDIFSNKPIIQTDNFSLNFASLFGIFIILFGAVVLIKNSSKLKKMPLKYNWLIFISIAFLSIFFSYGAYSSVAESLRLSSIFAVYCLSYFLIVSEQSLKNLIKAIIASVIIPSLFALYQFCAGSGLTVPFEGIYNRIYGTFAHPNLFAYYLILPLTLSLYLFLTGNKQRINSILYFLSAVFFTVILIFTFTRGAWLSFLIIIAVVGILRYRALLIATLILAALAYSLIEPINYRVNDLISRQSDSSIEWRINLWNDAKEYVKNKPFFGYGAGVANGLILDKRGEKFGSSDPHNDYLKIAIENGLIGLSAYILLIAGLFINLIKKYSASGKTKFQVLILISISLATAFFIMSFADNILRNTALMWSFWALMGAILSVMSLRS